MRSGGTISGRFGGFAAGHFILSALGMGGWLALARASAAGLTWFPIFPGYAAGLMLLYLPAGWLTAGFLRWPRADRKAAGLAVLLPALCAWCWAFGGWTLAGCSGAAGRLGFSILLAAFPLACPSALFMLAALQLSAGLAGAGIIAVGTWWKKRNFRALAVLLVLGGGFLWLTSVRPDSRRSFEARAAVARILIDHGRFGEAETYLAKMQNDGYDIRAGALLLAQHLAANGDDAWARVVVERFIGPFPPSAPAVAPAAPTSTRK